MNGLGDSNSFTLKAINSLMNQLPHIPVLLNEVLEVFSETSLPYFIDGTLGAGGHAKALLENHPEIQCYFGIDQDLNALAIAKERLADWPEKVVFQHGNFAQFDQYFSAFTTVAPQGILVDLGVSSMQLDRAERGFSFMRDGPLDMRMNQTDSLTAEEIINEWPEERLGEIFRDFGEEKHWRLAARTVASERKKAPIRTTNELVAVLKPVLEWRSKKGIHPLTLVFQGLRIAVNRELDVLELFLTKAIERLPSKGRLAVISFHSLEDRIVKNAMRLAASDKWDTSGLGGLFRDKDPIVKLITRKPLEASEEECRLNGRSRSAKLRVIEKL